MWYYGKVLINRVYAYHQFVGDGEPGYRDDLQ